MKKFLTDFYHDGDEGKVFTYALQLTAIAHREQVELTVDLDDVAEVGLQSHSHTPIFTYSLSLSLQIDPELAEAIIHNTRRYVTIFSEVVSELLPVYRQKEVCMWAEFQPLILHLHPPHSSSVNC